jgi:two-component system, cell cycle sensor histidine kinase PleC
METQRRAIVLQLAALGAAAIALVAVHVAGGAAQSLATALGVASALSLGWCSRRSLERETATREDARRLKTELLSNVSHELRTPLNAILGYAEILEVMRELPQAERDQMVTRILSNAVTLTCTVNNLLEYSTVVAGEGGLRPGMVRLSELFDELEPWVGRLIEDKPIAFAWAVDPNVPPFETDRSKLRQVVLNLLSNAAKFTHVGEIRLCARAAGSAGIEITVSDTGVGMSASDQTKIFEDFRQISGSATRPFGGIGLGLTLARRLCELLGGSLAVESTPARGTRVALRFPTARRLQPMEALRASM